MRVIGDALARHLAGGATTLCHCWRIELRSGAVLGFTDHDRTLDFGGTRYEAETGFTASEIEAALGLSVDNLEAQGALSSEALSEARLAAGDFDDAAVELWRVNWQEPAQRVLLKRGRIGEVTRGRGVFTAELRGLTHVLNQPQGRLFQYGCDAVLGDRRCGVDLAAARFSVEVAVASATAARVITLSGGQGFDGGFFANGTCRVMSGANEGRLAQVKFHRVVDGVAAIELWQPLASTPAAGDRLLLRAGCDRQFSTCRDKFDNIKRFRGFPHMPGDDFVMGYAVKQKKQKDRQA